MKVLGLENEAADPRFAKSYLRKQNETALLDVMSPSSGNGRRDSSRRR